MSGRGGVRKINNNNKCVEKKAFVTTRRSVNKKRKSSQLSKIIMMSSKDAPLPLPNIILLVSTYSFELAEEEVFVPT